MIVIVENQNQNANFCILQAIWETCLPSLCLVMVESYLCVLGHFPQRARYTLSYLEFDFVRFCSKANSVLNFKL